MSNELESNHVKTGLQEFILGTPAWGALEWATRYTNVGQRDAPRHDARHRRYTFEWHRARARLTVSIFRESAHARRFLAVFRRTGYPVYSLRHVVVQRSGTRHMKSRESARRERGESFIFEPLCR